MDDLKSCPFCGGTAYIASRYSSAVEKYFWFVQCTRCKAQTGAFNCFGRAVDAWNIRTGGTEIA